MIKGNLFPSALNQDAYDEWVDYRQARKKPLTDLAKTKVVNKLSKYAFEQQQAMVDAAIENDWIGLHPVSIEAASEVKKTRHQTIEEMLNDTSWAN